MVLCERADVADVDQTVFVAVEQFGIKGNGSIAAVHMAVALSGVQNVGVPKKYLAFFQMKGIMVDMVKHFSMGNQSDFDFRVPVSEKGTRFIIG